MVSYQFLSKSLPYLTRPKWRGPSSKLRPDLWPYEASSKAWHFSTSWVLNLIITPLSFAGGFPRAPRRKEMVPPLVQFRGPFSKEKDWSSTSTNTALPICNMIREAKAWGKENKKYVSWNWPTDLETYMEYHTEQPRRLAIYTEESHDYVIHS